MNTHPGLTGGPIYLDYNATTPADPRVVDAMLPYLTTHFGNPASGHTYGTAPARMQAWALGDPEQVGPKSELFDPRRPRWLAEEQVAKDGVIIERAWQSGRWHDGSMHVWLRYRVMPGRVEPSSGVRWDLLDRQPDTDQV